MTEQRARAVPKLLVQRVDVDASSALASSACWGPLARQTWPTTPPWVTGNCPASCAVLSRRHIARSSRPSARNAPASRISRDDETLHFAGGRLLLRGVNGSGKSTAMNVLLPFLLEADSRRIDAAGEQTGVLQVLDARRQRRTQRTGYLWIEFSRPDEDAPGGVRHHTVGCGIRANRGTDRATTWWFSTPRRARIDFPLTVNRVPLAVEALRAELGAEAV